MVKSNWYKSNRKQELPADWSRRRTKRLEADNYQCQWPRARRPGGICGQPANEVDHWRHRDAHEHEDLWSLCEWHHRKKTEGESAEARRKQLAKAKYPVERHPGLR